MVCSYILRGETERLLPRLAGDETLSWQPPGGEGHGWAMARDSSSQLPSSHPLLHLRAVTVRRASQGASDNEKKGSVFWVIVEKNMLPL